MLTMRQVTQKVCCEDGTSLRENRDMYRLLNYNIQRLLNQTGRAGEYGFRCFIVIRRCFRII